MKKLFVILVFVIAAIATNAQNYTYVFDANATFKSVSTAYTLTDATAQWMLWSAPKDYFTCQDFLIHLDSLTGNHTNVAVALYGRKFDTSTWVAIGSAVNWKGTTADTTIVISNATNVGYRAYKTLYTGTGTGTSRVYLQQLKLYLNE